MMIAVTANAAPLRTSTSISNSGFIRPDDGSANRFFGKSGLPGNVVIDKGTVVEFEPSEDRQGRIIALDVRPVR
jgi:cold shock CspA family protein